MSENLSISHLKSNCFKLKFKFPPSTKSFVSWWNIAWSGTPKALKLYYTIDDLIAGMNFILLNLIAKFSTIIFSFVVGGGGRLKILANARTSKKSFLTMRYCGDCSHHLEVTKTFHSWKVFCLWWKEMKIPTFYSLKPTRMLSGSETRKAENVNRPRKTGPIVWELSAGAHAKLFDKK